MVCRFRSPSFMVVLCNINHMARQPSDWSQRAEVSRLFCCFTLFCTTSLSDLFKRPLARQRCLDGLILFGLGHLSAVFAELSSLLARTFVGSVVISLLSALKRNNLWGAARRGTRALIDHNDLWSVCFAVFPAYQQLIISRILSRAASVCFDIAFSQPMS